MIEHGGFLLELTRRRHAAHERQLAAWRRRDLDSQVDFSRLGTFSRDELTWASYVILAEKRRAA